MQDRTYYTYIVASRARVLYVGVTSNIEVRMLQHKAKHFEGFTADYNCNRLVWYQSCESPQKAIAREKQLRGWSRGKKLALINSMNPTWIDLSENWGKPVLASVNERPAKPDPSSELDASSKARQSSNRNSAS